MHTLATHIRRSGTFAVLLASGALPLSTFAQESEVLDEVIVTGSRIARPNLTQPTPVTTVASDELRMSGSPDLGRMLSDLPSLGSTATLSGSSNSFDDSAGLNLPDLRRLGVYRTLTLVDGKRHVGGDPGTTAVDLGAIPISLVERVEIITGGASAVYGSDAVSGVINIITRKDFEGVEVNAETGRAWSGDYAKDYQASLTVGNNFNEGRGNFTLTVMRDHIGDVQARDVDHAREYGTVNNPSSAGENDGIPDQYVVSNILSDLIDENGVLLPNAMTSFSSAEGVIAFRPDGTPVPQGVRQFSNSNAFGNFPNGCDTCFGVEDYITLVPEISRTAVQTRVRYDLADPVSFYIDAKYVSSDVQEELQPSFNFGNLSINVADNPFLNEQLRQELLAAGETSVTLTRFHADAGPRMNYIERETKRVVTGFDGEFETGIGNLGYDVFFNYGETSNFVRGINRRIPTNLEAAIDAVRDPLTGQISCREPNDAISPNCVAFNPFGRTNTPEAIRYSFVETNEAQTLTQQNAGFTLVSDTSSYLNLPAGPLGWAFGFEWREEKTQTDGDALVQADLTENAAQPDQNAGYKVSELFLEVNVPLLDDVFLADTLELDAAFRAADYSHSGSVNAWKLGALWSPIDQVRVRGTISEAVRAPNIIEAFSPPTPGFADVDDPCDDDSVNDDPDRAGNCAALGIPLGFDAADNAGVESESSGNRNLDPEESSSFTVGIVYQPNWVPGLSFTVDYYDIEITDAIVDVLAQDIVDNCVDAAGGPDPDFCSLFTRDAATRDINFVRSTYVNASKLETQGIDVELRYTKRLSDWTDASALSWLDGNMTGSFVGTYLKQLNEFVFQDRPDEINIERGEAGDPIHAYRATLTYQASRFAIGWEGTYVGSVKRYAVGDDICEDVSPCELNSSVIHDLNARFFLPTEDVNMEIYAGVNNVLDKAPPYGILGVETNEAIYDPVGRRYFIGLRSSF